VLFRGALGDLELVFGVDGVAGVGASTDLAAVVAMAENLPQQLATAINFQSQHVRSPRCRLGPRNGRYRTYILRKAYCWIEWG
jgi:hypothetical protein